MHTSHTHTHDTHTYAHTHTETHTHAQTYCTRHALNEAAWLAVLGTCISTVEKAHAAIDQLGQTRTHTATATDTVTVRTNGGSATDLPQAEGGSVTASKVVQATATAAIATTQHLYSTVGIHPHNAKDYPDMAATIQDLRRLAAHSSVVAIGESGLDYNRNISPPDVQRTAFAEHVLLAIDLGLPLFLHERDAHADFVAILEPHAGKLPPTVVHCFTGTEAELVSFTVYRSTVQCHTRVQL